MKAIIYIGGIFFLSLLPYTIMAQQNSFKPNPLLIVDGKIVGDTNAIKNLDSDLIENINVLKGEAAVSLYGSKAKDGAVIITSKAAAKQIKMHNLLLEKIAGYEQAPSKYLFVKDGVLVQGKEVANLKQLQSAELAAVEVMPLDAAKAIYGSEAKEITVLINTKN